MYLSKISAPQIRSKLHLKIFKNFHFSKNFTLFLQNGRLPASFWQCIMGDLQVPSSEPGEARQNPGKKCYTIFPIQNFKSTLPLHMSMNPFQNCSIMLPKIEIRCFKEKFNNISSLFMKKRSLKSEKIQNGRFLKKIDKHWHKPGEAWLTKFYYQSQPGFCRANKNVP